MQFLPTLLGLLGLVPPGTQAPDPPVQTKPSAVMMRYPDVSQHAIVFRYAGDLWTVSKDGGEARRITSAPGDESFPKFSPDGAEIAFMANYDGESDIYVLPVEGGVPTRVTHHPSQEVLCDWHPGGERLLFFSSQASGQARASKLFLVPATGGHAEKLPLPYGTFGSINTAGEVLAYTPTSREFRTWKRYRGGMAQDIWTLNLATLTATQVTRDAGTDAMPMWHGSKIVFLSDRGEDNRLNLFLHDPDERDPQQLTFFDEADVRFPSMGPEDVVFENNGKLFRYHLESRDIVPIEVIIPGDRPALRQTVQSVEHLAGGLRPSPNAERVCLEARGDLFNVPVDKGLVRNLTHSTGVAERQPVWSPDGHWIAFVTDRSGEYEVALRRPDGKAFEGADDNGEQQLTELGPGWKSELQWSPNSKWLSFATNDGGLYLLDVQSRTLERVATNPAGSPLPYRWSPDSGWLTWSHRHSESRLDAIYVYDIRARRAHEVTSGMFDDSAPCFSRDGEWLFFHSSRAFEASFADLDSTWIYADTRKLMGVPLHDEVQIPWCLQKDDSVPASPDASDASVGSAGPQEPPEATGPEEVQIDLQGFEARIQTLPVPRGRFESLRGTPHGLAYLRLPNADTDRSGSSEGGGTLQLFRLEEEDEHQKTVLAHVSDFEVAASGDQLLVHSHGRWSLIECAPEQELGEAIQLAGLRAYLDPRAEWAQLVQETWRLYRDFFYDPGMHAVDWDAVRDRILGALEDATSREDVHFLIGEMIAELNVGHAYNRPAAEAEQPSEALEAGLLGCDWSLEDGHYRIARILRGGDYDADSRSPLRMPGVAAQEGDYLLAVNGIPVDTSRDVFAAFLGLAGEPVLLTLASELDAEAQSREVLVKLLGDETELRYRDWVRRKREYVAEASGGRIGYIHVPDTSDRGQAELMRQFLGQMHERALVIDERWNSGGRVPTRFIELLDRPLTNFFAVRHGEDIDWPPTGHRGPKAMLINHASGSGGDAFPYLFRLAGLGQLIGTRTWGGLVGLSDNPSLIDGAQPTVPRFAFYELDGTWGVEGHGVDPDIEVVDDPALMLHGEDPQLDAAVEHLLAELERWPFIRKTRPESPDRSGSGIPVRDR